MHIIINEKQYAITAYTPHTDYITLAFNPITFEGSIIDALRDTKTITIYDDDTSAVVAEYNNISIDNMGYRNGNIQLQFRIDQVDDKIASAKAQLDSTIATVKEALSSNITTVKETLSSDISSVIETAAGTQTDLDEVNEALLELSDLFFEYVHPDEDTEETTDDTTEEA